MVLQRISPRLWAQSQFCSSPPGAVGQILLCAVLRLCSNTEPGTGSGTSGCALTGHTTPVLPCPEGSPEPPWSGVLFAKQTEQLRLVLLGGYPFTRLCSAAHLSPSILTGSFPFVSSFLLTLPALDVRKLGGCGVNTAEVEECLHSFC